jgi:hypothetical protein
MDEDIERKIDAICRPHKKKRTAGDSFRLELHGVVCSVQNRFLEGAFEVPKM